MSLDKAVQHGKEHRKPYYGSKAIDPTCRNHGSCDHCSRSRLHSTRKRYETSLDDEILERNETKMLVNFGTMSYQYVGRFKRNIERYNLERKSRYEGYDILVDNYFGMSYETIRMMLERIFDVVLKRPSDFTDEPLYPIPEITEEDLEAWVNAVALPEDLVTQIDFFNTDGKPDKISVTLDMRYIHNTSETELREILARDIKLCEVPDTVTVSMEIIS